MHTESLPSWVNPDSWRDGGPAALRAKKLKKVRFGSIETHFAVEMHACKRFRIRIALFSAFSTPNVKPIQRLYVDGYYLMFFIHGGHFYGEHTQSERPIHLARHRKAKSRRWQRLADCPGCRYPGNCRLLCFWKT
ncbi:MULTISPECIES: hypothetical protein [unclassified Mesorhizobium]|uniref:hypothetical protein n=1 Tax=unclassified Mesorhizobium TaxID=325217 RepID=UPI00333BFB6A